MSYIIPCEILPEQNILPTPVSSKQHYLRLSFRIIFFLQTLQIRAPLVACLKLKPKYCCIRPPQEQTYRKRKSTPSVPVRT